MNTEKKLNMTMLCDFYELTMGNGYLKAGYQDRITYFDVFFRDVPDKGGFAICAGFGVGYARVVHCAQTLDKGGLDEAAERQDA